MSVTVFWQLLYCFHVHFPLSLHSSLIIQINISFKFTLKCPVIVDNNIFHKFHSFQSILVFSVRFTQYAAVIWKMDVTGITMQQTVYQSVEVSLSVSKSGLRCLSHFRSLVYASRLKNWALEKGVCIYT